MILKILCRIRAGLFAALFLFLIKGILYADQPENRGIWIVRDELASKAKIDAAIKFAVENDFTDIFVQVRGRGDAYYQSSFVPGPDHIKLSFDPLGYLLEQTASYDIRVHAWVNVLLLWSNGTQPKSPFHPLNANPEWTAVDSDGKKDADKPCREIIDDGGEGIYLSPLEPEVRVYLLRVFNEIVTNYDVDGLHLDYIRYPQPDYGFHIKGRREFKNETGLDPILLTITNKKYLNGMDNIDELQERYAQYRRDQITRIVRETSEMVDMLPRKIILSAAVKPDPAAARNQFYQDWEKWLEAGWIDLAIPMNYSDNGHIFEQCATDIYNTAGTDNIWMGIGAYKQNAYETAVRIIQARKYGFSGIVIFSYTTLKQDPRFYPTIRRVAYE